MKFKEPRSSFTFFKNIGVIYSYQNTKFAIAPKQTSFHVRIRIICSIPYFMSSYHWHRSKRGAFFANSNRLPKVSEAAGGGRDGERRGKPEFRLCQLHRTSYHAFHRGKAAARSPRGRATFFYITTLHGMRHPEFMAVTSEVNHRSPVLLRDRTTDGLVQALLLYGLRASVQRLANIRTRFTGVTIGESRAVLLNVRLFARMRKGCLLTYVVFICFGTRGYNYLHNKCIKLQLFR